MNQPTPTCTIEHQDLPCYIITRCAMKGRARLCGYIAGPLGHPWHGKSYDDFHSQVHGGLTYSSQSLHAEDGRSVAIPIGSWIFGFDCAHYGDGLFGEGGHKDASFVRTELASLRAQAVQAQAVHT